MASERVIIVGAGGISNAWFPPLREEGVTVAAVVDLDPERARAQVEKYGLTDVAIYADQAKAMAANTADFLLDLTIPDAHAAVTCAALEAGLPVIGEKPMAATLDQARQMVETSERTGKLYMVSQSRRWEPHHDSLARTVAAGRIGQLTALHCDFFLAAHFGGFRDAMDHPLILDMAVHHFDLARLFSGLDAVSVYAEEFNPAGSWYAGGAAADCWFEMAGGVRFNYRGSWCAEGCRTSWNGDWRVLGTHGTLLYIVLRWGAADDTGAPDAAATRQTTVTMTFEALDDGRTLVSISESGWLTTDAGLKASYGNCEGWTGMLCALKVWIEHGITLRQGFYK